MTTYFVGRISHQSQCKDRQIEKAHELGIDDDRIFIDTITGVSKYNERPQLNKLLEILKPNDAVVCMSIDRLGRSVASILELVQTFKEKQVSLKILDMDIDTSTPLGEFFLNICASFSQLERSLSKERQRQGIEAKKKLYGQCGGRPKVAEEKLLFCKEKYLEGELPVKAICDMAGISRAKFYQYIKENNITRA